MNVLHIITCLDNGGAEAVLYRLVTADKKNVHYVISLMSNGIYSKLLKVADIPVYCLNMPRSSVTYSGLSKLFRLIKQINPDVIQTWMIHADLLGGIISRISGSKNIVWGVHSSNLDPYKTSLKSRLVYRLCALLSKAIPSAIISCSDVGASVCVSLGYSKEKMIVIHNGYNITEFSPNQEFRNNIRRQLGVHESDILIGMVARWDPQKDHANLINALSLLDKKVSNTWKCLLVGTNMVSSNKILSDLLKQANIFNKVILFGPSSDIPGIMNGLDIHVLSSSYGEAFPNVIAEAMACGVPCVVTDVGDAKKMVGKSGWCVTPNNSAELAKALETAYHALFDGSRLDRSQLCRNRVSENFSLETMTYNYSAVWKKVLSENEKSLKKGNS